MAKADKRPLSPEVLEYFAGERNQALRWFETPSLALGRQCPKDLSAEQLRTWIIRLKAGMTA